MASRNPIDDEPTATHDVAHIGFDPAGRASTSEGGRPPAAKSDLVNSPAPLRGLQDWYLRASDGEWDSAPGIPVDPLDAAHAWAALPVRAERAAPSGDRPRTSGTREPSHR